MERQAFIDSYVIHATKRIGDIARVWAEDAAELAYDAFGSDRAPEECAEEDLGERYL